MSQIDALKEKWEEEYRQRQIIEWNIGRTRKPKLNTPTPTKESPLTHIRTNPRIKETDEKIRDLQQQIPELNMLREKEYSKLFWEVVYRNLYLASNFSNTDYPKILAALRKAGYTVFDFRSNDMVDQFGSDGNYQDPDWTSFKSSAQIRKFLVNDKSAATCYARDRKAIEWADTVICICPSGISAALEVAFAAGQGKLAIVYLGAGTEKGELMWHLCSGGIVTSIPELLDVLEQSTKTRPNLRQTWPPSTAKKQRKSTPTSNNNVVPFRKKRAS